MQEYHPLRALTSRLPAAARWVAAGAGLAAGAYAAHAAFAYFHYGRPNPGSPEEQDPLLDRFLPAFEVVERHHIRIAAPAAVTFAAAVEMDLLRLPVARAIIRARELLLRARPDDRPRPRGLLAEMLSLGWGVLGEEPGREIVVGAVTKPWEPNVTFRALPPDEFAAFREPDLVKIAWTLRVDPVDEATSIFRTETRAVATGASARARFRRYWAFLSPGIAAIRWASLDPLRRTAERRARETNP